MDVLGFNNIGKMVVLKLLSFYSCVSTCNM